ncbi:hypothetical protein EVAR_25451_1 [Eumeta japonica]|uniref:Uncharacterized protein n=1 Tax=Eumeta variegata TaxID=151549 RepID=A0A4C1VKJ7_EUMVA|nr:hypothetical protein EVAR_25451_1 [Eumeta japonica]
MAARARAVTVVGDASHLVWCARAPVRTHWRCNQEEWATLAHNKAEMKRAVDELYQLQRYYNGNQEEQRKLKFRKAVDELYEPSLTQKVYAKQRK